MTDSTRRRFLAAVASGGLGILAGCSVIATDENRLPAGSLQFANEHHLPHTIGLRVTDVTTVDDSEELPPIPASQKHISATAALEPGEKRTYAEVFTEPVKYDVAVTIDGRRRAQKPTMQFAPFPTDSVEDRSLRLVVGQAGRLLGFQSPAGALERDSER